MTAPSLSTLPSLGPPFALGGLFLAPSIHAAANEICPNHPRRWGEGGEWSLIKVIYCFHQNNDASKCEVAHTSFPIRPSKSPADWVLGPILVPRYWSQEGIQWHRNQLGSYLPSGWR